MTTRPYHVVVWGTTGVVGRLVAEHIARDYKGQGVKWAMAGRNRQKLESVREKLAVMEPSVKDVPIIVADASDRSALEKLSKSTKVVLATAGPFAVFGTPMVEACLATSTNYCDITGESNWVRKMIRAHDAEAKRKGIRIVNMAGFDSIPSDLGAFLVAEQMQTQYGKKCGRVECLFTDMKGALSGGTVASLFGAGFDDKSPDRKGFTDPYGLDPPGSARGPDGPDSLAPGYSSLHGSWHIPFVMAPVNTKVVRRSNALQGRAYGDKFSYTEAQAASGRIAAYIGAFIYLLMAALITLRPMRSLLIKLLPAPGHMPKRDVLEGGVWKADVVALSDDAGGGRPAKIKAHLIANGDPGYWTTSRMLLESGLCIALQEEELNASNPNKAGFLTPAAAFGQVLVKRLNKCNGLFSLKIVDC